MKLFLPMAALFFLLFGAFDESYARAGRSGGSFGSRGSRTYSAPVQNAAPRQQATQSRQTTPTPAAQMAPRGGGLFGGLAGGLAGGIIGGLLFSSLGHAAVGPGAAGGLGLFDILLIGGGIFLIIRLFKRKKSTEDFLGGRQVSAGVPAQGGVDAGLGDISRMDGYFDEEHFMTEAIDIFFNVQAAWVRGDVEQLRSIVAPRALETLRGELDAIKSKGLVNRVEGLAIKDSAITEAWQEKGTDYITLKLKASAIDYIADASGSVVEGSSTEPVQFTEYWTFAREIGKDWKLSAIQQPS
ncbi:MAG: Tim44 domain-containing protein [Deltaproteobacteria bacterium]|nr:Tim44 domain-containing protein [Deltaproteobacteria bacterium]